MRFPYSTVISADPHSDDFLLLRRPEIPVTIHGSTGSATYVGLVDTGSDNTILPKSVAELLGIALERAAGPAANVFGGGRVELLSGEARLQLESQGELLIWQTELRFFEFADSSQESIILGHAGFLDFFTATFDGREGLLMLTANDDLPLVAS